MGDNTYGQLTARIIPQAGVLDDEMTLREQVIAIAKDHVWDPVDPEPDDSNLAEVQFGGQVRCGAADEMASELDDLIERTGVSFAYFVSEDPAYEWLGSGTLYIPDENDGDLRWSGDVDANGTPVVTSGQLVALIDKAESVDSLRDQVARLIGRGVFDAWKALDCAPLSQIETDEYRQEAIDDGRLVINPHAFRQSDDPNGEPRCAVCGVRGTWVGPNLADWVHVS